MCDKGEEQTDFIQIDCKISEKMDTEVGMSHTTVTLNESQDHANWYENVQLSGLYTYQVWKKFLCKSLNTSQRKKFL